MAMLNLIYQNLLNMYYNVYLLRFLIGKKLQIHGILYPNTVLNQESNIKLVFVTIFLSK